VTAGRTPPSTGYRRGEPSYRRITLALFAAGMTTFVAMYAAQAVLPQLAAEFDLTPAAATLAVSATTGMLALAVIPASVLSERFGRVPVMAASSVACVVLGVLVPLAPTMGVLIAGRALQGLALAGVPATAMAYLAEEVDGGDLGAAMGRYIAGTTLGGLAGRVLAAVAVDVTTWRWALEVAAGLALVFTVAFLRMAPPSRRFHAKRSGLRDTLGHLSGHLRDPVLVMLYATAFLAMGCFVGVYNLLAFRLLAAPFALSSALVGLVFLMYLSGTASSALAGRLADRHGRRRVLLASELVCLAGLLATVVDQLGVVLVGMLVFTAGFFGVHAVASGWVSARATAHRGEASSLYVFFYYLGSSVLGALAGVAYAAAGWRGIVGYGGGLVGAAIGWCLATSRLQWGRARPAEEP
jgi:YNFM family putative membrane transporter